MNESPESILLSFIQEKWAETTEGITKNQIVFTDKDVNTENGTFQPHVIIMQAGARRLQPEEDSLYEFTLIIKATLWSRWTSLPIDCDKKQLHWQMVSHIKKMFDGRQCPEGWEWAYVESTSNIALAMNLLLPDLNEFNLTIKAVLPWT